MEALNQPAMQQREAVRALLLPVAPGDEEAALAAVSAALDARKVPLEDRAAWIRVEHDAWRAAGKPSAAFRQVVAAALAAGGDDLGPRLGRAYFALHKALRAEPLFDHDAASALLSHARLIVSLARDGQMSGAPIARVLQTTAGGVPVTWEAVRRVLVALGHRTPVTFDQVKRLYEEDCLADALLFADAHPLEVVERIDELARQLGHDGDLREDLLRVAPVDGHVHAPYLQILHFLCSVVALYDAGVRDLYEFRPRGRATGWLFARYPRAMTTAGSNAALNNAKAQRTLDRGWASARRQLRESAHGLVGVLECLEGLSLLARRELAAYLRAWLCRLIRLAQDTHITLPPTLSPAQVGRLLAAVAQANTRSQGVIEQRVVDALAAVLHPAPWVARGLGDSVNANNVSRRKCGDCDFQHVGDRAVVAYEAHGGTLTEVYLLGHQRSLEGIVAARRREWDESIGRGQPWQVTVTFVAHAIAPRLDPARFDFAQDATTVGFEAITYHDLIARVGRTPAELCEPVAEHVLSPLNEARTPDAVRQACLTMF